MLQLAGRGLDLMSLVSVELGGRTITFPLFPMTLKKTNLCGFKYLFLNIFLTFVTKSKMVIRPSMKHVSILQRFACGSYYDDVLEGLENLTVLKGFSRMTGESL